jgi:hypothetical protein
VLASARAQAGRHALPEGGGEREGESLSVLAAFVLAAFTMG